MSSIKRERSFSPERSQTPGRTVSESTESVQSDLRPSIALATAFARTRGENVSPPQWGRQCRSGRNDRKRIRGESAPSVRDLSRTSVVAQDTETKCTCPISYSCEHRRDLLDCRQLVPDPKSWDYRRDEEAWARHRSIIPSDRGFTEESMLASLLPLLVEAKGMTSNNEARRNKHRQILNWIYHVEERAVDMNALQATRVVEVIEAFVDPQHMRMLRQSLGVPSFIIEELTRIARKWSKGDLSVSPSRGLLEETILDRNGLLKRKRYLLDRTWKHYQPASYFGAGDLINGQCWRSRVELIRDGAHGTLVAGIYGSVKEGAYSVYMKCHDGEPASDYADIDMHHVIDYVGTPLDKGQHDEPSNVPDEDQDDPNATEASRPPTKSTQMLLKSLNTQKPVRVIRSCVLAADGQDKQTDGFRYDGLYRVTRTIQLKKERQIWSFRMERLPVELPHQGPLRSVGYNDPDRPSHGRRPGWSNPLTHSR